MSGTVTALAAGATSGNVLLGQQYELAPFDGTAEFLAFASGDLVTVQIFSGSDVLVQPGGAVPFGAAAAAPVYPDHLLAEDEVAEGDRLNMEFRNGSAAARTISWRVMLTPA